MRDYKAMEYKPTMKDVEKLLSQAVRYRRLAKENTDRRTVDALSNISNESEDKATMLKALLEKMSNILNPRDD